MGLNHSIYSPDFVIITEGKKQDISVDRIFNFPKENLVAMNKRYNDYALYKHLKDKTVCFVTRLKGKDLTSDQTIDFTDPKSPRNLQFG